MVTQNSQAAHIARLAAEDVLRCTECSPSQAEDAATTMAAGGGSLASHSTENRSTNSGKLLERAQCSLAAKM